MAWHFSENTALKDKKNHKNSEKNFSFECFEKHVLTLKRKNGMNTFIFLSYN